MNSKRVKKKLIDAEFELWISLGNESIYREQIPNSRYSRHEELDKQSSPRFLKLAGARMRIVFVLCLPK